MPNRGRFVGWSAEGLTVRPRYAKRVDRFVTRLRSASRPHPVFITGGTKDLWADPKGEFLAEVEAGSVYRLLGKKDLGETEGPPLDKPLTSGDLGFHFHTGGHAILPADWAAFLSFADKYLK